MRKPLRDMTVKELLAESKRLLRISQELSKRAAELSDRVNHSNRKKK